MSVPRPSRRPRRKRYVLDGGLSKRRGSFERLEDRRLLAVTASVTPEGVFHFAGDAGADSVEVFVEGGILKFTGATPASPAASNVSVDLVTSLTIDLGGGDNIVHFGGAASLAFPNGRVEVSAATMIRFSQSLHAGGDLDLLSGDIEIAGAAVTLSTGEDLVIAGTIDGVPVAMPATATVAPGAVSFGGRDFMAWQRSLGVRAGATRTSGDCDGDGDVDRADLAALKLDFDGTAVVGPYTVGGSDLMAWQRSLSTSTGATLAQGDLDGDGDVDRADLMTWRLEYGQIETAAAAVVADAHVIVGHDFLAWQRSVGTSAGATAEQGDLDGDGDVDRIDLILLQGDFGEAMAEAVEGAVGLTLQATGQIAVQGAVGSIVPLGRLTIDAGGQLIVSAGEITLDGNTMTFNSPVLLAADLIITDSGDVTFNSTVDGAFNLTVNTTGGGDTVFNGAVGDATPLNDLTTDASGRTLLSGQRITTTGVQVYNDGVELTAHTTLVGRSVVFGGTVDGAFDLAVNTSGAGDTAFNGLVGGTNPLRDLTTNADGRTLFGGGGATTTGDQTFNDAVLLTANATLVANDVRLQSKVDGAFSLSINTTLNGDTTLNGPVGGDVPLVSLTTNADGRTLLSALALATTGDQVFNDPVVLLANTTISANDITFNSTVDGAFALTLNSSGMGVTSFNGAVGDVAPLASLATNADGRTQFNGARVRTSGDQNYADAIVLVSDTTITSGAGNVSFASTIDGTVAGNELLDVRAPLITTFGGVVGGAVALESLATDGPGETRLNITAGGVDVRTVFDQTFGDAVLLGTATVLNGNDVRFLNTVNGAFDLTVNTSGAGETEFRGAVGGTTPLASLTTNADGRTLLGGLSVTTIGDQIYNDAVRLTANATLSGNDLRFLGTIDGPFDLNANTNLDGDTEFRGAVGDSAPLNSLTTNSDGRTVISGLRISTSGDQTFGDAVLLAASLTLATNNARFLDTVDGPFDLTVNTSGNGDTEFRGAVGDAQPLQNVVTNGDGRTLLGGLRVTTTGDQTYGDRVVLTANATLAANDVRFNGTVDGTFALTVTTTGNGDTSFAAAVGDAAPLQSLFTNADGRTLLNGLRVRTIQDQTYNDPVVLGEDTVITSTTGNVTFANTVNGTVAGAQLLDVRAPLATTFTGVVGGVVALESLTTDAPGQTRLNIASAGVDVTTVFDQTYNNAVVLGADTTLRGNDIRFISTVDGGFALTVETTTNGDTEFRGAVGDTTPLVSLMTNADGRTLLGGLRVRTTADQTYNDAVVLTANATITARNIRFDKTVDGAFDLTVNSTGAGDTVFNGAVGGATPLASLTTNADGRTLLSGLSVRTSGDQIYNDAVLLTANTTLEANDARFFSIVNGAFSLAVNTSGSGETEFRGAVGGTTPLTSLTTNADGRTRLGGLSVATTGDQVYNDAVVLQANATLTANDVQFDSTVDGPFALIVNTTGGGNTTFNGPVGDGAPLQRLETNADGSTILRGQRVRTAGSQTYRDAVLLAANATLTGQGILFDSTVDGAFALTVNSTGASETRFNAPVGGVTALASLTTNADGRTLLAGLSVRTTGDQLYNDAVTLLTNTALAGNDVRFFSTIDGGFNLTINTAGSGETEFRGAIGDVTPLVNLTTNDDGRTLLGGLRVRTTADQTYNDAVVLTANATLNANDVRFASTVNGAFDLIVNTAGAGDTVFGGVVGGVAPLVNLTTNADGRTLIGANITTSSDQTYNDAVLLTANATLTANDVRFISTVNGAFDLVVVTDATGDTEFRGAVGDVTPLASLRTNSLGRTLLNGLTVTTTGDQTYEDRVVLGADATLTGNDVRFKSSVDGAFALLVNTAGAGVTEFGGPVGDTTPLASLTTNADGQTILGGLRITTTGDQTYNDAVVLANHAALRGNNVRFFGTVNSDGPDLWDLDIEAVGFVSFAMNVGTVNRLRDLIVDAGGAFTIDVTVRVSRDIEVQVRESASMGGADDITLENDARLFADRDVTLRAGDDVTLVDGAIIDAAAVLRIDGDFGDNDPQPTTISMTNATDGSTNPTPATGILRGVSQTIIRGGGDSTDRFFLQAERLTTPGSVLVQGYQPDGSPDSSATDEFFLFFGADFTLAVGSLTIDGGSEPGDDRLTIDHSRDAARRLLDIQYTTVVTPGSLPPSGIIDGSAASFTGLGTTSGFNTMGVDKYTVKAGAAVHDQVIIRANDQVIPNLPQSDPFFNMEQRITVGSDASAQWQILGWEAGQLIGSNIRDAIVNNTGVGAPVPAVPMLIEGGEGNDTLAGGPTLDVIFAGPGVSFTTGGAPRFFNVGATDAVLTPPGVVRAGDALFGAGGDDFLFADVDLFRDGLRLWGLVTPDVGIESDLIDGAGQGSAPLTQVNHAAQSGASDIVRNITGMLIDGGATKDVLTWLMATPMELVLTPEMTSDALDMLIEAAFRGNDPVLHKIGLLSPPFNAQLDDFDIEMRPFPVPAPPVMAPLAVTAPAASSKTAVAAPTVATSASASMSVSPTSPAAKSAKFAKNLSAKRVDAAFAQWGA